MRKGIAVPYVIALLLGVAVIGLVGFWFASTGGKFSGQSQSTYCQSEALKWCTQRLVGGDPTFDVPGCTQPADCESILGSAPGGGGGQPQEPPVTTSFNERCDLIVPSRFPTCGSNDDGNLLCVICDATPCREVSGSERGNCKGRTGYSVSLLGSCTDTCVSKRCSGISGNTCA